MNKLIVLAYNEELGIEKTILELIDHFEEIIVINDKSKDGTLEKIQNLSKNHAKVTIISNNKNLGPGKSMDIGIKQAISSPCEFIVKIDGDNQFKAEDIKSILSKASSKNADFIKCDRFWVGGVKGKIPKIRYLGNSFASLLIKIVTGNWKINDPLNGLFLFSYDLALKFKIPKFFNRYGYPFFINAYVSRLSIDNDYKLYQYKNQISYGSESSKLNPITVFLKLIIFSISYFASTIKTKVKYSTYQLSGLIDLFALTSIVFSVFSLIMTLSTRYFGYQSNQGAWLILFVIMLSIFFLLIFQTQKILRFINEDKFTYLN